MQETKKRYDVIIVGASVAGNAAAILFAREGLRVALVERNKEIDAYKKACTHFIQPSGTPVIQRLGLAEAIEDAGGLRNSGKAWTRYGWIGGGIDDERYGYTLRRQLLDPLMRRSAAQTDGVDFMPGMTVTELVSDGSRVIGVRARTEDRSYVELQAQLVVGADGRYSRTAELAGIKARQEANHRFSYFAYFRNVKPSTGSGARVWYLEPDVAFVLPNDSGLTLLVAMPSRDKVAEFKQDLPGRFLRFFDELPDGPDLSQSEQVSPFRGMLQMPNVERDPVGPGLALVGDAAMATDPVWGTGISSALRSAAWLVDSTAAALRAEYAAGVDWGLQQYRLTHRQKLAGRHRRNVDYSRARPFNVVERLMYAAAAQDDSLERYTGPYSTRLRDVRHLPPPKAMGRALLLLFKNRAVQARNRVEPHYRRWLQALSSRPAVTPPARAPVAEGGRAGQEC